MHTSYTLAVFKTAPKPVEIPHPSKPTLSNGALLSILANEMDATTVYSENVDVPMKWYKVLPLHVKRDVPSGITPCPWVLRICEQTLVFGCLQNLQVLHCGMYSGITWSPATKSVTPSPTLSTMPAPSWPKITGNKPSGSHPAGEEVEVRSLWKKTNSIC